MAQYSKAAQNKVKEVMEEMKEGKLMSGRSGRKVMSRKQAIAIDYQRPERLALRYPGNRPERKLPVHPGR